MAGLLSALRFLTIIPIPGAEAGEWRRHSYGWFPIVGAFIGAVGAVGLITGRLVSSLGGAALAVAALAAVTGALHLDGLADCFDSMGGHSRDQRLAILRDSRVGTYGLVAVVLLLVLKVAALSALDTAGGLRALVAAAALARWTPMLLAAALPYARSEGLGSVLVEDVRPGHLALAGLVATGLAGAAVGVRSLALLPVALLVVALVGLWARRTLHGITGDVMGACTELAECALLCVAAALH